MDDSTVDISDVCGPQIPWDSLDAEEGGIEAAPDVNCHEPPKKPAGPSQEPQAALPSGGGGWTLPLLCGGIALIACCALIPQADENRRLVYERQVLRADLQAVEKQVSVSREFLKKVGQDPTLAERLAQRQMKVIPEGSRVLDLPQESMAGGMSPFQLVNVPPPAPLPPYKPISGFIARLCYDPHSRLYVIGVALGMIATGLVLGSGTANVASSPTGAEQMDADQFI